MWIAIIVSKLTNEELQTDTTAFETRSPIIEDIVNRQLSLRKIKISGVQKITITLTIKNGRDSIVGPIKGFSPVVNIKKAYDFRLFNASSEREQNELIVSVIENSLREAAKRFTWDFERLNEVLSKVREFDFKNFYQEWKLKSSRDKRYRAGIEVETTTEAAKISTVFYSQDNVLIRKVSLINVRPSRYFIKPLMGVAKWVSNTEFELIDKRKEVHSKASPLSDKAELYFLRERLGNQT